MIPLVGGIEIRISEWVEEKIRSGKAVHVWLIIIFHGMRIEQFPRIKRVVARFLQPHWQKVVIKTAFYEFWITT